MTLEKTQQEINRFSDQKYKYGFETIIDSIRPEKGLNEEVIKFISSKKKEPKWMLEWRLKSFDQCKLMADPS